MILKWCFPPAGLGLGLLAPHCSLALVRCLTAQSHSLSSCVFSPQPGAGVAGWWGLRGSGVSRRKGRGAFLHLPAVQFPSVRSSFPATVPREPAGARHCGGRAGPSELAGRGWSACTGRGGAGSGKEGRRDLLSTLLGRDPALARGATPGRTVPGNADKSWASGWGVHGPLPRTHPFL